MRINDILMIERNGIINTINEYTREHFITNYTTLFHEYTYPKEKNEIMQVTERLLEWYDNNIDDIRTNEFVRNKHEHEKSIHLLTELHSLLIEDNS